MKLIIVRNGEGRQLTIADLVIIIRFTSASLLSTARSHPLGGFTKSDDILFYAIPRHNGVYNLREIQSGIELIGRSSRPYILL